MLRQLGTIMTFLLNAGPYLAVFFGALAAALALVPLVREMNRRLGMMDKPSARRINTKPIPRGGGLAVVIVCSAVAICYSWLADNPIAPNLPMTVFWKIMTLSLVLTAVGFIDDYRGLKPVVKLGGQLLVAFGIWAWAGLGFTTFFPALPGWADAALTVFWIVGAINAFNLIDGLDGLAAGLAVIAAAGMAVALFFIRSPAYTIPHLIFIGALLGFLRYNFNPASVFLGDTGSMYIGFMLSVLTLASRAGDSYLVGIGVPLLAMGVPIFDTTLAILRRTVRRVLSLREKGRDEGNGQVMQADTDHLHHRLLRQYASQRKVAWALYALAFGLVATGLGAVLLRDRAAALFILGFMVAVTVVVKDMSRIELWDTGRLLEDVARARTHGSHRWLSLLVPFYVASDLLILTFSWLLAALLSGVPLSIETSHTYLPLRVLPIFVSLVWFRAYTTVWGRAQISNYIRLFLAVAVGSGVSVAFIVWCGLSHRALLISTLLSGAAAFFGLSFVRLLRNVARDILYTLSARRMRDDPDATRLLIYGAGLRYRAFRRELVRSAVSGHRYICGIIDDDILLRGHYIGGIRVDGPYTEIRRIARMTGADEVIIAADISAARLAAVTDLFASCGLRVRRFTFSETILAEPRPATHGSVAHPPPQA